LGLDQAALSREIPKIEVRPRSRKFKRERGIWQHCYREHQSRNDDDQEKHLAYIHFNPIKQRYVIRAAD
jgi:putative transposase